MAYTDKGLNTLHFNRPAVVLFKKPLATNDEMTVELEKLLGTRFPIKQHNIRHYSGGGKIKAIFYRPADPNPKSCYIEVGYNQNLIFNSTLCTDGPESVNTRFGDFDVTTPTLPYGAHEAFAKRKQKAQTIDSVLSTLSRWISVAGTKVGIKIPEWKPKFTEAAETFQEALYQYEYDATRDIFDRTWYVFVFDSD